MDAAVAVAVGQKNDRPREKVLSRSDCVRRDNLTMRVQCSEVAWQETETAMGYIRATRS